MSDRRWLHFTSALLALAVAGLAQDAAPKPYRDVRKTPLSYNGPGRDDPEPTDVQEVRIGYFGPPDASDANGGQIWQGASLAIEEANLQGGFQTKGLARDGRSPDYTAAHAYDAANIVIAAIRTAGLNRPRIRDAVQALSPARGVTGVIEWDGQGQNRRAVSLQVFTSTPRSD